MIIAGEASGDLHGGNLVRRLGQVDQPPEDRDMPAREGKGIDHRIIHHPHL